jgi:hypothetical protein
MAIANIDKAVLGHDTAKGWRGRYYSQAGAMRVMGRGGPLQMARQVAKARHWRRIERAQVGNAADGDRGVALTTAGPACVIRFRGFWIGRHHGAGNLLATDREILMAWSVV